MIEIANIKTFNFDTTVQGLYPFTEHNSKWCYPTTDISIDECDVCTYKEYCNGETAYVIDADILQQMQTGSDAVLDIIMVSMNITAPMYWWNELSQIDNKDITITVQPPRCRLCDRPFDIDDFSTDAMTQVGISALQQYVNSLESFRQIYINGFGEYKKYDQAIFNTMLQMLPASYNLYGTLMINYQTLRYIYNWYNSLTPEWRDFCAMIEELPYAKELICR